MGGRDWAAGRLWEFSGTWPRSWNSPLGPRLVRAHPPPGPGPLPAVFLCFLLPPASGLLSSVAGVAVPPLWEGMTHPFGQGPGRPGFKSCPTSHVSFIRYMDGMAPGKQSALHIAVTDKVSDQAAFHLPVRFILSPRPLVGSVRTGCLPPPRPLLSLA